MIIHEVSTRSTLHKRHTVGDVHHTLLLIVCQTLIRKQYGSYMQAIMFCQVSLFLVMSPQPTKAQVQTCKIIFSVANEET
jgi:hypothetical protein